MWDHFPIGPGHNSTQQHPLDPAAAERIRVALEHTHSRKTKEAYALAWRQFSTWKEGQGLSAMPTSPVTVAAYLTDRAKTVGISSLTIAVAAIRTAHRAKGAASPINDEIGLLMKGLRRMLAEQGRTVEKQAEPLREEDLLAIIGTAKRPRELPSGRWETKEKAEQRGTVDIALACLMRDAGLRRGGSRGAAVAGRDQDGGRKRTNPYPAVENRPSGCRRHGRDRATSVQARRGSTRGAQGDGPGVRPGHPTNLDRLRKAAEAAGLPNAEQVSGHSGRVGLAQRMVENGAPLAAIMRQGRWKTTQMVGRYVAHLEAGEAVQYLE